MRESVAVVGLGYVGLPLAVEFGKKFDTIGYDLSAAKIDSYRRFCDPTGEVSTEDLRAAARLSPTTDPSDLRRADFIVVAVPTPVDVAHIPDFAPLIGASTTVAQHMKKGAIVIYESTVYPGATEEVCVPVLERHSGLRWKRDFHVGYSPERVNPGDKEHTVSRIIKVVSGDDDQTLVKVADLYASIITASPIRYSGGRPRGGCDRHCGGLRCRASGARARERVFGRRRKRRGFLRAARGLGAAPAA
jgi:UDP-N-acetyl-D-galactosamine dehydrogenase